MLYLKRIKPAQISKHVILAFSIARPWNSGTGEVTEGS